MKQNLGFYNKAELISFLEAVIYNIGVTEKRAYFVERVKEEIGFTNSDYQSTFYNQISKTSLETILMYIKDFSDENKVIAKSYLLELISCDPYSPISKIGMSKILKLSKEL